MPSERNISEIWRELDRATAVQRRCLGELRERLGEDRVIAAVKQTTTIARGAELAGICEKTLRRWISRGHDITVNVGGRERVSLDKLALLLEGRPAKVSKKVPAMSEKVR